MLLTDFALKHGEGVLAFNTKIAFLTLVVSSVFVITKKNSKPVKKSEVVLGLLTGVLFVAIIDLFGITGLKLSSPTNMSLIYSINVVFTFLFSSIFMKEKVTYYKVALIFLTLFLMYLFLTEGKLIALNTGDLFLFGASFLIGFGNVLTKKLAMIFDPPFVTFLRYLGGASALILFSVLRGGVHEVFQISLHHIITALVIYLAIMCLSKAFSLLEATRVSVITVSSPIVVAVASYLLFGNSLSIFKVIVGLGVLFSIYIFQVKGS